MYQAVKGLFERVEFVMEYGYSCETPGEQLASIEQLCLRRPRRHSKPAHDLFVKLFFVAEQDGFE